MKAIETQGLSFTYRRSETPVLNAISLDVEEGEFIVLMGRTGGGKSSLLRCLNNIIPKFCAGEFGGEVRILGEGHPKRRTSEFAGLLGMVFQDFESQLFSTNATLEVVFGMENLGLPREEMRRRLSEALQTVGLAGFEDRDPTTLSGGQKQRLAIASVLATRPRILVLDEPTTDLDPAGKRAIFEIVRRLRKESGMTIVMVEHETEHARSADRIVVLNGGKVAAQGRPEEVLPDRALLAENAIRPLPIPAIFSALGLADAPEAVAEAARRLKAEGIVLMPDMLGHPGRRQEYGPEIMAARDLRHCYANGVEALKGVSISIRQGEFVALLGQNGSGKTTLVKHFNGLLRPTEGVVTFRGGDVSARTVADLGREIGYVFQNPDHQIFSATVRDEIAFGLRNASCPEGALEGKVCAALAAVGLSGYEERDPFALTKGERQRIAVASILALEPKAIVLDEPTTGLDYAEQVRMMDLVRRLNENGHTILIVTHSMWVAAEYAHRAVVMADGLILADGDVREVFSDEAALEKASLVAPDVVLLSKALGTVAVSVPEFIRCAKKTRETER